jgi:hypothetical protein
MNYEEAQEVRQTRTWTIIVEECNKRIASLKEQLTTCPPDKLIELQLKLRTWAEFKRLPDDVVDREQT